MKSFRQFLKEHPIWHGSTVSFNKFQVDATNLILDRAIGVHFASTEGIADKFAKRIYKLDDMQGNFLYKIRAPSRGSTLKVAQRNYFNNGEKFAKQSDQTAIGAFVATTVFEQNKDLFVAWIVRSRHITPEQGSQIYDLLKAHKAIPKEFGVASSKYNSINSYVSNFDSGLLMIGDGNRMKVVMEFDEIMKNRGIDALTYQNTSPMETRDIKLSPKTYIILTHALDKYPIERITK